MAHLPFALAHDYLTQRGGAERVVASWVEAWPRAPLFTTLYDQASTFDDFAAVDVRVSPLNRLAYFRHHHRSALPLLPVASRLTTIDAEVTLASSSGWAHGFNATGHLVVYCHAPARWLYQTDRYLSRDGLSPLAQLSRPLLSRLREWDQRAAHRADTYIVNSTATQSLVHAVYGIEASVVAPPVNPPHHLPETEQLGDVLVVARLLPYKNVDLALEVARLMPDVTFRVVGDGPLRDKLTATAPTNVTMVGSLADEELWREYVGTSVHLALSHEDFGITPLEAAAVGRPTVARRSGGYLDTITSTTGILVEEQNFSTHSVVESLRQALTTTWDTQQLRDHAATFSTDEHIRRLRDAAGGLLPQN